MWKKSDFFWFFCIFDYNIKGYLFIMLYIIMKKILYILSTLLVISIFSNTWTVNAIRDNDFCGSTTYDPISQQCCPGNQVYPITQICPLDEDPEEEPEQCNWIKLNTNFPIIWNCIGDDSGENEINAFPSMLWALTKIVMSLILVVCFILVIVAWIMRAADKPDPAKKMLKRVAITILLLWFSGVILKLVNPNFFY